MAKKIRVLLIVYILAALVGLGGLAWAAESRLNWYRSASDIAAARAFEEAVTAADALSLSLKKLSYAGDEALGKSLCAQAHAAALSCDTALSVLPFATQELEGLLGFLNRAGDYTASLCALSAETLEESDRQHLQEFGEAAAGLADSLRELQAKVHGGEVAMDRQETPLRNVGEDRAERLSARLLDYENSFAAPEAFAYEGQFSPEKSRGPGTLTDSEARAVAAKAASQGKTLDTTMVVKDAFVFYVHAGNPVDNLSLEQIKQIYGGKATDWKDVGSKKKGAIEAFQRPKDSENQSVFSRITDNCPLMEPPTMERHAAGGVVIHPTADYRNSPNAIGYSYRSQAADLLLKGKIKLLSIDGVAPTPENILNGTYPYVTEYYMVTLKDGRPEEVERNIKALRDFIFSPQGKELAEKCGLVPVRNE